ncbi:hypothetical protein BABINDRAFT_159946 [Babjeviella inositovora NRRL Y-12698]|uniref:Vta1 C-terminal domain-containing protein n=1 Tax=Babjeviella inositovora NRRL Y-12698 TaxID=984486 RepID=A0A1E3QVK2_9ASCO|nr:uncharacterized protein BABINDRAFT_159946 [Babjeviella inositovora NRRL Y-12698]ODQ81689.1 hypothetical protein BABINDRAFT_159946 [Babjeviella inositovora NRRL Y-12698]
MDFLKRFSGSLSSSPAPVTILPLYLKPAQLYLSACLSIQSSNPTVSYFCGMYTIQIILEIIGPESRSGTLSETQSREAEVVTSDLISYLESFKRKVLAKNVRYNLLVNDDKEYENRDISEEVGSDTGSPSRKYLADFTHELLTKSVKDMIQGETTHITLERLLETALVYRVLSGFYPDVDDVPPLPKDKEECDNEVEMVEMKVIGESPGPALELFNKDVAKLSDEIDSNIDTLGSINGLKESPELNEIQPIITKNPDMDQGLNGEPTEEADLRQTTMEEETGGSTGNTPVSNVASSEEAENYGSEDAISENDSKNTDDLSFDRLKKQFLVEASIVDDDAILSTLSDLKSPGTITTLIEESNALEQTINQELSDANNLKVKSLEELTALTFKYDDLLQHSNPEDSLTRAEIDKRIKYCMVHALRIWKSIKIGTDPNESFEISAPSGEQGLQADGTEFSDSEIQRMINLAIQEPDSDSSEDESIGGMGAIFPAIPSHNPTPNNHSQYGISSDEEEGTATLPAVQRHSPHLEESREPPVPVDPTTIIQDGKLIEEAQKWARYAISALNYEDVDTAEQQLVKALEAVQRLKDRR